ncbi:class I adenylate-forming enzyme family protein [Sneathiella sp. HT1-7]|uniref:class I adenylate-forming enzyme family protein n=1 Tax=Sneathiella sp. HT1-7 TaxID=2887192 RepID=UPI001D1554F8|nr:AMP-binding protein [Sneathiella sp. HT1-7]MCC3306763.1 AMP-binding protein [Sneathiella sp. HT1-7]
MTVTSLAQCLENTSHLVGNQIFISFEGRTLTFAEFDARTSQLANVLKANGAKAGEAIGLYLSSCPEMALGYWACQKVGAIANPISSMNRVHEVKSTVTRTDMKNILTNRETLPYALEVRQETGKLETIFVTGGAADGALDVDALADAADTAYSLPDFKAEDVVALFFTSGTTGAPKGAMQTQLSQYTTLRDMAVHGGLLWGQEVFLCALPLFNNFGATCMMNGAIFSGAKMIQMERWDTDAVLEAITREKVTYLAGSPTMFLYLLRDFDPAKHDLSSLKTCVTGGSPVSPNVMQQFEEKMGVPLLQIYGATESTGYVTGEPLFGVRKRGSAGVPLGGARISIVNDNGTEVSNGEIGEVRISGDTIGAGYWGDTETTAASFTPDGWLSGDLGYLDEDGYLFIVDRKKDVIISGGYNIYPLEVEDLLYQHPSIRICAVIGLPDKDKSEIPVAVVIPHAGHTLDAANIIAFCRKNLSAYKSPRRVYTVDDMPLGPSNKILKRTLRDWYTEGQGKLKEVQ